jgi:hypothetical protein
MHSLTILSIFVFIVILIIFLEYRNEKKYQEKRRQQRQAPTPSKPSTPPEKPKKVVQKPEPKPEPKIETKPEPKPEVKVEPKPEPKPEPTPEVQKETKKLPEANYPQFTHVRLVEMGLSDEEAKEFVAELIPQIETEIPLIKAAIEGGDFHKMERLTHGIKGSATNLGTGGVSDLLSEYNTYLKTGTDIDIAKAYLEHLIHYTNELKAQYT